VGDHEGAVDVQGKSQHVHHGRVVDPEAAQDKPNSGHQPSAADHSSAPTEPPRFGELSADQQELLDLFRSGPGEVQESVLTILKATNQNEDRY